MKKGFTLLNSRYANLTGFTLTELLVTVIILSILAALAVPQYTKTVEKGKMREAEANLYTMYMAQKMYKLDHPYNPGPPATGGYVNCGPGLTGATGCNTKLEVEMTEEYFENWQCTAGTPPTTFTCRAERKSGRYKYTTTKGCYVTIDQTGTYNDNPVSPHSCP